MHTIIDFPRQQKIYGVIELHLHIFMSCQFPEIPAPGEVQRSVNSVHHDPHINSSFRCLKKSCHDIASTVIIPEVKCTQYDSFLRRIYQPQPPQQCIHIIIDAEHPLLLPCPAAICRLLF